MDESIAEEEDDLPDDELVEGEPAPTKKQYTCRGCGYASDVNWSYVRGLDRSCPGCRSYYSIVEPKGSRRVRTAASLANRPKARRYSSGVKELDHVLGGEPGGPHGFVRGCTILFGGPPGVGKSTLLLQACAGVTSDGKRTALYAGDEMDDDDVGDIAARIGSDLDLSRVRVLGNTGNVERILEVAGEEMDPRPTLLVVDSAQTVSLSDVDASEGSSSQVEAVAQKLTWFAKQKPKTIVVLICHVNSQGDFRGTETLKHLVDALVWFGPYSGEDGEWEGSGRKICRLLVDEKNRKGPVPAEALLEMNEVGKLVSVERRSNIIKLPPRK